MRWSLQKRDHWETIERCLPHAFIKILFVLGISHLYNASDALLDQVKWNLFKVLIFDGNQKVFDDFKIKTKGQAFAKKKSNTDCRSLLNTIWVSGLFNFYKESNQYCFPTTGVWPQFCTFFCKRWKDSTGIQSWRIGQERYPLHSR